MMWEIWNQKIPFDGDLNEAVDIVLKEQKRPMIREDTKEVHISQKMARLIRMCWQTSDSDRPPFSRICELMQAEVNESLQKYEN